MLTQRQRDLLADLQAARREARDAAPLGTLAERKALVNAALHRRYGDAGRAWRALDAFLWTPEALSYAPQLVATLRAERPACRSVGA